MLMKTGWRRWLNGLSHSFRDAPARRTPRRPLSPALRLERLEDRLTPSFDLTVASAATTGVATTVSATTTTFTAVATGAVLNSADIITALNTGDVVVDSGSTGAENGDITINVPVTSPLASGHSLIIRSGSNAAVGDITVNADFTPQAAGGTFPLSFVALNDVNLNAAVNAGGGTIILQATNGAITEGAGDTLTAAALAVASSGSAALGGANSVGALAAQTSGAFSFVNGTNPLTIDTVGGVSGLASSTDVVEVTTGGTLTLNQGIQGLLIGLNAGGAVTQAGGAALTATAGLVLQGAGPFTLTNPGNSSPSIAASVAGDVNYANAGALQTATFNLNGFGNTVGVSSTNGAVTLATAAGDLMVNTSSDVSAAKAVVLPAGGAESLLTVEGNVTGASAVFTADRMALNNPGTVNVGAAGVVLLHAASAGRPIDLGGTGDPAGVLQLSSDDLNVVTAGVLRIGDAAAGAISVTAPISPANVGLLSLTTGGAVMDPNTVEPDITVAGLAVRAAGGISLNTQASQLAFSNTAGVVSISNTGALALAVEDGLAASSNTGGATNLSTIGALTLSGGLTSAGPLTVTTTNSAGATDGSVTVPAGAAVRSTGGDVTIAAAAGLDILGPVTAPGFLRLTGTGAIDVAAALTGTTVVVTGNGAGAVFTIAPAGSSPLILIGLGGGDTFDLTLPVTNGVSVISSSGGVLDVEAAGSPLGIGPGGVSSIDPGLIAYTGIQTIHLNDAAAVEEGPGPDTADRAGAFTGLTAQERFVQALYLDDLGRAGTKAELDGWVGLLNAGGSPASVAVAIDHSAEAHDRLVRAWYEAYLGRAAVGGEEQGWGNLLQSGQTEEQVLSGILASPEFYARAQTLVAVGSADQRFVQALYQLLIARVGEAAGVSGWVNAVSPLGRQATAQRFLGSAEFRADDFEGNYNALLHRPDDAQGLNGWVFSNLDAASVRMAFEAAAEFFNNG